MKILATVWFLFLLIGPIVCFLTNTYERIVCPLAFGALANFVWDELRNLWGES
jgi:hypothetical protein